MNTFNNDSLPRFRDSMIITRSFKKSDPKLGILLTCHETINLTLTLTKIERLSHYNTDLYKTYMALVITTSFLGRHEMYDVKLIR